MRVALLVISVILADGSNLVQHNHSIIKDAVFDAIFFFSFVSVVVFSF
jgi:hypothetical protein